MLELIKLLSGGMDTVKSALAQGHTFLAGLFLFVVVASFIYIKFQSLYKKGIQRANLRDQTKAQIENPIDNKADEINQKKAENEIEDILKGGH